MCFTGLGYLLFSLVLLFSGSTLHTHLLLGSLQRSLVYRTQGPDPQTPGCFQALECPQSQVRTWVPPHTTRDLSSMSLGGLEGVETLESDLR